MLKPGELFYDMGSSWPASQYGYFMNHFSLTLVANAL